MGLIAKLKHHLRVRASLKHEAKKASERSPRWKIVEHDFVRLNPDCAACGGREHLQVHHEHPFHLHPELELDPKNLIGLCMGPNECHLLLGHGDNFKAYNPGVRLDAAAFKRAGGMIGSVDVRAEIVARAKAARLF